MKTKHFFGTLILIVATTILITMTTCKKKSEETTNERPTYTNGHGTIGPSGGIVTISDNSSPINGVKIDIPEGAVNENFEIKLSIAPDSILSMVGSNGLAIKIEPEGLLFDKPFQITFPLVGNPSMETVRVYYINEDSNSVTQLPIDQFNQTNKTVTVSCNHFSNFCVNQDDGVWTKQDMYYIDGKIGARVYFYWHSMTGVDYGLEYLPTTTAVRLLFGPMFTKQFVNNNCFLISCPDLYENLELKLKEKNYAFEFLDPTKSTVKLVVKRIGNSSSNYGAEVYLDQGTKSSNSMVLLYSSSLQSSNDREAFFQGKALFFKFDFTPDPYKEYYIVSKWGITDFPKFSGLFVNHVTSTYNTSNRDFRLKTSNMITQNIDQNNNSVVDSYESIQVNQPPNPPSNATPANNATNVSTSSTLSWSCADPENDPLTYDIYFGTSNYPPLVSNSQIQTNYTPASLSTGSTYHWKIVAKDNHSNSTPGSVWTFTTGSGSNNPPNPPSNPNPANNATNISTSGSISWTCSDPENDPLTFDIYFGTSADPPAVAVSQTQATYIPPALSAGITYYWKIMAFDSHGYSTLGQVWKFTTVSSGGNTAPVASFTIDPASGTTSTVYNFNASGCTDPEDPLSSLQVRWDWEGDGTWETQYATNKITTHQYSQENTYTVKMEVKDSGGLTDIATKTVTVSNGGSQGEPCPGMPTIIINHVAGSVAPVNKTVTYGTVTNIPGELTKCWITSNLGADHKALAVDDATEASAGWYWQFNHKQGYKHDGTTRTPNTTWVTTFSEISDWETANDPCAIELGNGWRIPTNTEWTNVDAGGNWTNWNGPYGSALKLHAAGYLSSSNGEIYSRGESGYYWSRNQNNDSYCFGLTFNNVASNTYYHYKAAGFSIRCLRD